MSTLLHEATSVLDSACDDISMYVRDRLSRAAYQVADGETGVDLDEVREIVTRIERLSDSISDLRNVDLDEVVSELDDVSSEATSIAADLENLL